MLASCELEDAVLEDLDVDAFLDLNDEGYTVQEAALRNRRLLSDRALPLGLKIFLGVAPFLTQLVFNA